MANDDDDISLRCEMRRIDSWLDDGERPTSHQVRWLLTKSEWQIRLRNNVEAERAQLRQQLATAQDDLRRAWDIDIAERNRTVDQLRQQLREATNETALDALRRIGRLVADESPVARQRIVCELWRAGGLSEGQAAKLLHLNRIEARQLAEQVGVQIYGDPEVQP